MQTLQTINKTKTYDERKEFNVSHPDEQRHIDMTNLIDDYIEVALHMKKIRDIHQKMKRDRDFDFQSYIDVYGINTDDTGTLQTNGFYIDGKMTPFVSWADDYHTKYSLYHGKILEDIFKAIFTVGISHEEIVKVVEERDMWHNS